MNVIQVPRCVNKNITILGDISSSTYAVVVYLVIKSRISTQFQLLASKKCCPPKGADHSKVGALCSVNTGKVDCTDQDYTLEQCLIISNVCCWTDSNNVLYWIKGKNREWKQFVNNRVAEIR